MSARMIRRLRRASMILLPALAGCAAPAPPSPASIALDGTYVGVTQLVGFSSPDWQCDWQAGAITVAGGRIRGDIDGAPMIVPIGADGSFNAWKNRNIYRQTRYMQVVHLSGRITGGVLEATVHQPRCTFVLQLKRQ
ncbi:MAG: hypothetical protein M3Y41_18300 [Pseudomonadota bacterium]|nr:hypothetical protein [Pseudomonadota bacterium]